MNLVAIAGVPGTTPVGADAPAPPESDKKLVIAGSLFAGFLIGVFLVRWKG